jgi:subtilisin family serine protease
MRNGNPSYGKWVWLSAGLLSLVPAVGVPPGSGDARTDVTPQQGPPAVEVSVDEPWNRQFAHGEVAAAEDGNQVLVAPKALGPAADGTLSVLVHFDPQLDVANRAGGASPVRTAVRDFAAQRLAWVQYEYEVLPNVVNIRGLPPAAVEALKQMPGVVKVEEDYEVHSHHNDSMPLIRAYQSQLQGAGFTGVDGAGIRCCVIDTGIDSNSIMYSTRIDAAAGWDFVNNDSNPEDDNGHGSHVSGTVLGGFVNADFACATTGPESMQGVAPAATLIGVKVLAANGSGSFSNVIAGINRCASPTLPGGPADVINLSLGGGQFSGTCDTDTAAQAVNNAVAAGVVVVASAGNNGYTNAVGTPACASGAIAVAATYDDNFPNCDFPSQTSFSFCLDSFCLSTCTDNSPVVDQRCCFSNRSSKIDVAAPGCITFSNDSTVAAGNGLVGFCGTSQAGPHVAGLAALLLDANPALTPADVRTYIRNGAIDLGAPGFDSSYGWGRIDAINSLTLAAPPAGCTTDPECSDGQFCNGAEVCNAGICQAGTPPNCADSVACTTDTCNETTDSCDHTPNNGACDDGLFCNGAETCNVTLGCQAGTDPCAPEPCNEGTDTCGASPGSLYLSFLDAATIPGVGTVQNEDIVAYDLGAGTWSWIFDGSDVGLSGFVIDGLAVLPGGDLLLSFTAAGTIGGISSDDSDILRFTPTSLGSTTSGSFTMYFDGSDVGLTTNNEDVDAIGLSAAGNLLLSTLGGFTVAGVSGANADLIEFTATSLGSTTSGSFAMYFDGSDVGLTTANEDVDGAGLDSAGNILLSTLGSFSVTGVSGNDEDVFEFAPTSLGSTTAGTYSMFLDLSAIGIDPTEDVGGLELVP